MLMIDVWVVVYVVVERELLQFFFEQVRCVQCCYEYHCHCVICVDGVHGVCFGGVVGVFEEEEFECVDVFE